MSFAERVAACAITGAASAALVWAFASHSQEVWKGARRSVWSRLTARLRTPRRRRGVGRRRIGWGAEVRAWARTLRRPASPAAEVAAPAVEVPAPTPVSSAAVTGKPSRQVWPTINTDAAAGLAPEDKARIDALFDRARIDAALAQPTAPWPAVGIAYPAPDWDWLRTYQEGSSGQLPEVKGSSVHVSASAGQSEVAA